MQVFMAQCRELRHRGVARPSQLLIASEPRTSGSRCLLRRSADFLYRFMQGRGISHAVCLLGVLSAHQTTGSRSPALIQRVHERPKASTVKQLSLVSLWSSATEVSTALLL